MATPPAILSSSDTATMTLGCGISLYWLGAAGASWPLPPSSCSSLARSSSV